MRDPEFLQFMAHEMIHIGSIRAEAVAAVGATFRTNSGGWG